MPSLISALDRKQPYEITRLNGGSILAPVNHQQMRSWLQRSAAQCSAASMAQRDFRLEEENALDVWVNLVCVCNLMHGHFRHIA